MALPPLPLNNTARYFVEYTTGRLTHSLIARADNGITNAAVDARIADFLASFQDYLCSDWQVLGVTRQGEGAEFSLPVSMPLTEAVTGGGASPLLPIENEPRQVKWTGRSLVSGRQVNVGIFGLLFNTPGTYRIEASDPPPWVAPSIAVLDTNSFNGVFLAIDNANVQWKQYVNVNYNSYWETAARG